MSKLGDRPTVLVHRVTIGTYRIDLTIRVRQPQRCGINQGVKLQHLTWTLDSE